MVESNFSFKSADSMVQLLCLLDKESKGKVQKKHKKLTNVSLYVCMSAENSKMLVFYVFFPNSSNLSTISMVA